MSKIDLIQQIIQASTIRPGSRTTRKPGTEAASGQSRQQPSPSESSQVNLSATARQLLSGNGAPVDSQRVDAVSKAIANGSYKVDSGTVARDIAASVRTGLARGRKS